MRARVCARLFVYACRCCCCCCEYVCACVCVSEQARVYAYMTLFFVLGGICHSHRALFHADNYWQTETGWPILCNNFTKDVSA